MKAIGLYRYLPVEDKDSLQDITLPKPEASGHDLLVAVKAVSVNPVDTKIRAPKDTTETEPRVLRWDAAGEVGNQVYYAGDITRSGTSSKFHLVDERIVGRKPEQGNTIGKIVLVD